VPRDGALGRWRERSEVLCKGQVRLGGVAAEGVEVVRDCLALQAGDGEVDRRFDRLGRLVGGAGRGGVEGGEEAVVAEMGLRDGDGVLRGRWRGEG